MRLVLIKMEQLPQKSYKVVFKAYNIDEATAAESFVALDANKDGKIDHKKLISHYTKLWWFVDDEATGAFGQQK